MGCGLNKLEKQDEKRPGNIYSTLKRPQVETKIDVTYEYRCLEFTTLSAAELPRSSAVRLASLRDLPSQLLELYQQGFSLAALHPFVQPTHQPEKTPLEHIFRAVLVKKTERSQKADLHGEGYVLELESCSSLEHLTNQKIIPEFIKKIQEAASQGLKFVGVIPQYRSPVTSTGGSPRTPPADSASDPRDAAGALGRCGDGASTGTEDPRPEGVCSMQAEVDRIPEADQGPKCHVLVAEQPTLPSEGDGGGCSSQRLSKTLDGQNGEPSPSEDCGESLLSKMEIFALFNKPRRQQMCRRYYPVTIPLRVSRNGQTVSSLDANWLEHMSDHFRKGGVLVNAVFYLGMVNDSLHGLTDGVFIFEAVSAEDSKSTQGYDAIVVEQWTVLEGVEVQTDYVPLLNSLAAYGWQLTCVLPTPVIKTTRDGNISTKQIVFLQRPCLPQKIKKKESKWRFSREDTHSRHMRKLKGKRGRRRAGESEKDLEEQTSKSGDVGTCLQGLHTEDGVPEGSGDTPCASHGVLGDAVQNGPVALSGTQAGGCSGPSDPGEPGSGGGDEGVAGDPTALGDN
ncbi:raftlin [Rhynchocyon petersi]